MGITVKKVGSNIEFNTNGLPGSGDAFAEEMFLPVSGFAISKFNNRVVGRLNSVDEWSLSIEGTTGTLPVSTVEGVAVTTIDELYTALKALM